MIEFCIMGLKHYNCEFVDDVAAHQKSEQIECYCLVLLLERYEETNSK